MPIELVGIFGVGLIVWFQTDAVFRYLTILRLVSFSTLLQNYRLMKEDDPSLTLCRYIRSEHSGYFPELVTCPVCLTTVLSILLIPVYGLGVFTPAFFGLLGYGFWTILQSNAQLGGSQQNTDGHGTVSG